MIARENPWYRMYYFIKAVATTGVNINNVGIKIIPLLGQSVITNNILTPDLALKESSIIKSIHIFYQTR